MKIIMLYGANNTGKTTTQNIVHALLLNNGGVSTNKEELGLGEYDFSDIVIYKGKTVAFYTAGDLQGYLCTDGIDIYSKLNVDVLICAYNTSFKTPPQQIVAPQYQLDVVKKTVSKAWGQQVLDNVKDANTIFNILEVFSLFPQLF